MSAAKLKKLKWWGWLLISISLIIVIGVGCFVYFFYIWSPDGELIVGKENPYGFAYLDIRPDGDTVTLTPPDEGADQKALAAQLYQNAATKAKEIPYFTVYNDCKSYFTIGRMVNVIDVNAVMLKDADRFFKIEYHLKNNIPLFNILPDLEESLNTVITMVTTERVYTDASMDYAHYQKTLNNKYDSEMVPVAKWNDIKATENIAKPVYRADQEGVFQLTQHLITAETIKEATVTLTENNTYYVTAVLDLSNPDTTAVARESIIAGTGDKNADYSEITVEFEVWDNGYFRNMKLNESWEATVFLEFSSRFEHSFFFSYNRDDARLEDFAAAKLYLDSRS
jgi:hypothetical protein